MTRTNLVLAVLLLVVAILAASIGADHSRPNVEFLPEMKRSPAYHAFAENPAFPNRRTLQTPVAGTIARGELPLHYAATKEDAERAGVELRNPYDRHSTDPKVRQHLQASIGRGSDVYRVYCVCCHGPSGLGDGLVTKHGFPPPPSMLTGKSLKMEDGQLFHILTYGQGSMSSFAAQLSRERRWDVINYVRSLQPAAANDAVEPNPMTTP